MRQLLLSTFLVLFTLSGLAQSGEPELISIVEGYARQFEELVPAKKLDKIVQIYAEDAIYGPENNVFYQGKEEIRKAWQQTFTYEIADFKMDPVSVYGDKKTIYEAGVDYSVVKVQGQERKLNFKYVNVWRKEGKDYKLVIDTYNILMDQT